VLCCHNFEDQMASKTQLKKQKQLQDAAKRQMQAQGGGGGMPGMGGMGMGDLASMMGSMGMGGGMPGMGGGMPGMGGGMPGMGGEESPQMPVMPDKKYVNVDAVVDKSSLFSLNEFYHTSLHCCVVYFNAQ
jgi:hypothetical protein